jgi:hypothetical protein
MEKVFLPQLGKTCNLNPQEKRMRARVSKFGICMASLLLVATLSAPASAADKKDSGKQTMTGVVSDSMCGAKHMMEGGDAACTRACVSKGSKYALVVGDKVYTLETSDKTALDQLDKLAGQKAKVSGTVSGDTIQVSSVAGA